MAIPPLEPHDNRDFLRPGRMTDSLLTVARIDRLLQLLERRDIPPQQRVRLLNALNGLQQQHALLKSQEANNPSSSSTQGKEGAFTALGHRDGGQAAVRVVLGEMGRTLYQQGEVERALDVKGGLEKALSGIDRAASDANTKAGATRAVTENYLAVAAQVPPPGVNEMGAQGLQTSEPRPVFGLIPPLWLPEGLRTGKWRSAGDSLLLFVVAVLVLLALLFI
ncbi:hypothetical protein [Enterobacillus tribolii]|uniref:Uncharacterized protein n=1 Tax=Enterobacillus tribolii TaxID=1487935 RepID=A0A370QRR6_9GAMM|nr:hypothetical protein [Enterobacillus tribolii]MBW7983554.1 hypothetical protein [Enterobacillus tribolii]RDK91949.1 hypothetical protein C8D90_104101 [Enterobacillus tribolii]